MSKLERLEITPSILKGRLQVEKVDVSLRMTFAIGVSTCHHPLQWVD